MICPSLLILQHPNMALRLMCCLLLRKTAFHSPLHRPSKCKQWFLHTHLVGQCSDGKLRLEIKSKSNPKKREKKVTKKKPHNVTQPSNICKQKKNNKQIHSILFFSLSAPSMRFCSFVFTFFFSIFASGIFSFLLFFPHLSGEGC